MNKLYIFLLGFLVLSACTTQKKRSDQSAMKKAWHNTNAHYNGYFNANESIEESILVLNEQHEDNYLKRLDVYEYVEADNPQAVAEQLDEAVKKVAIVVNLHPYSQWSDDCYLLAGKALFLKQDYESAEKAFRFLIKEYPPQSKEDKVTRTSKKKSSKSSRSKSSRTKSSSSSSAPKAKTKKERDRERRAYNKEVARKKKQRERDRKNGKKTPARTPKNEGASKVETPQPATPTPVDPDEMPRVGLISISGDAETGGSGDDGDQYKMKHRPAFQESQLWLARTLIERDNYNGARRILNKLEENTSTFKDVRRDAAIAQAHLSIKEGDYTVATAALNNAITRLNDKETKARLAFILGQLQQELGNSSGAYAAYEQVVKFRPTYEMVFAAELNMAQNAYLAGGGKEAEAMANLEKLLKDDKNKLYKDQIYFAMAQIALSQGDEEKGIVLIQQSLASNTSNRAQKSEAYYYLAEFFYSKESYLPAKLYYDSTLTLMAEADERYVRTKQLRDNLIDIATNLEMISLQDSLLLIAEYTPEQRADLAKKLQNELNEEAKGGGKTGRDKFGRNLAQGRGSIGAGNPQNKNDFWAYDEGAKKRRERAYKKRWGDRVLEDNWRRSNSSDTSIEGAEAEVIDVNMLTQEQIDDILEDVPETEGARLAAELKIKKAMFELGRLYKDRMENSEKCIEILEKLNARFPGHLYEMDSWYYLYVAHTELGHTAKAKIYRDKIIQKYPSSNYGQILVNPNYAQEQLNEEFQLNKTYDEVYSLFEQGKHEEVLIQVEQNINRIIGKHVLKPRYALLKAMSTGNTKGKDAYVIELQKVIATYAESPEATRAKEILRLLGGTGASLPGGAEEQEGDFTVNESELHYVLIVFESDEIDLNANKITVSDYNKSYHSLDRIRISNVYLGEKNNVPVLVLRRFKNKDKAMEYYDGIQKNSDDFIDTSANPLQIFPITQSNYREVLRNRTIDGYGAFFRENY